MPKDEMLSRLLPSALAQKVVGPIRSGLADLASTAVDPEVGHIEGIPFQITVEPDGTFEAPNSRTVLPGHTFSLRALGAFMQNPDPHGPAAVNFNLEEDGRGNQVFRASHNFAQYMTPNGPQHIVTWEDSVYRFRVGATISAIFEVDEDLWTNLVASRKILGITLYGTILKE